MTGLRMGEPRDKVHVKQGNRDVIECALGRVWLECDGDGIARRWGQEDGEPQTSQIDAAFQMIRAIVGYVVGRCGMTDWRLEIAARLSRLATEVREGSQVVGVEQ
jgi:hypothetical protein